MKIIAVLRVVKYLVKTDNVLMLHPRTVWDLHRRFKGRKSHGSRENIPPRRNYTAPVHTSSAL